MNDRGNNKKQKDKVNNQSHNNKINKTDLLIDIINPIKVIDTKIIVIKINMIEVNNKTVNSIELTVFNRKTIDKDIKVYYINSCLLVNII